MKSDNKLRQPRRRLSIKAANPYHDKGVKRENTDKLILKKQNTPTTGQTTPSSASLSFNKLVTSTKQAISELLTKIGVSASSVTFPVESLSEESLWGE